MTATVVTSSVLPTAALLTPRGRGAVATIRVCGDDRATGPAIDRYFTAVNGRPIAEQALGRICFGHWRDNDNSSDVASSEEVVVCRTSDSIVEVHCHGGDAAVNRVLAMLADSGVAGVTWEQQHAEITSPFKTECHAALTQATTGRTAGILLEQSSGLLFREIDELHALAADAQAPSIFEQRLQSLIDWSDFGRRLTEPARIVLAGRPNVGKSTLINALLGYSRAIVFDEPGTTRDIVTGETAFDGWPVQLSDTAGIRETVDELEREGIERTRRAIENADLVCLLIDVSQPAELEDMQLLDQLAVSPGSGSPCLVLHHKADLPRRWDADHQTNGLAVSSVTGSGVDELMTQIVRLLVPSVPATGTPIPVSVRQSQWLKAAMSCHVAGDSHGVRSALQDCLGGTP
jgi:tRNA modification GTPase